MHRRRPVLRALPALAALAALSLSPPAAAQDPGASPSVTKDATQLLYNDGLEAAKQGAWDKAYEAFSAAWRVRQHPQIALNLGRAALKTARYAEAAERLTFFLRHTKDDVAGQDRALIQQLLAEARQRVVTLLVRVNRPGAEVLVDDQVVGQAPLEQEIFVDPGAHTVSARLGAERAEAVEVNLQAGASRQIGLMFGGEESTVEEEPPAEAPKKSASLDLFGDPDPTWLAIGGVATGVGLVSGIVFTVMSNNKANAVQAVGGWEACYDPIAAPQIDCVAVDGDRKDSALFGNIAFWSLLGAGVAGVGTLAYAFLAPERSAKDTGIRVLPAAAAGGGGVAVTGRW